MNGKFSREKKKSAKVDKSGREGKEDWRIEEERKKIKNGNVQTINQMDRYTMHVLSLAVL